MKKGPHPPRTDVRCHQLLLLTVLPIVFHLRFDLPTPVNAMVTSNLMHDLIAANIAMPPGTK
jgi:hypothetical protein